MIKPAMKTILITLTILTVTLVSYAATNNAAATAPFLGRWQIRYDDGHTTTLDIRPQNIVRLEVTGAPTRTGTWERVTSTGTVFRVTLAGEPPLTLDGRLADNGRLRLRAPGQDTNELELTRDASSAPADVMPGK